MHQYWVVTSIKSITQEASTPAKPHRHAGSSKLYILLLKFFVVEQQQAYSATTYGEPCIESISTEVAAVVDSWTTFPKRKKAKNAKGEPEDHASPLLGVVPCASSQSIACY
ncbi:hypothetical protein NC653_035592 [Populus alba x Populus x berolinensis]|uniref:Uncharacterized protein n=1 Tax=Populus alba x Populus x berolinensis TaxID=444605 RepID=A0AAD6LQW0_9ROSI|nr:hypothetical protein NC653_035592 [Populus alba x Populus x berolinensis]